MLERWVYIRQCLWTIRVKEFCQTSTKSQLYSKNFHLVITWARQWLNCVLHPGFRLFRAQCKSKQTKKGRMSPGHQVSSTKDNSVGFRTLSVQKPLPPGGPQGLQPTFEVIWISIKFCAVSLGWRGMIKSACLFSPLSNLSGFLLCFLFGRKDSFYIQIITLF